MSTNQPACCALCGGPVDEKGRTVVARPPVPARVKSVGSVSQLQGDDPLAHMTPGERFARAVDRRDALVRDRRQNIVDRRNPLIPDRRTNA